jgi:hypothetical protein
MSTVSFSGASRRLSTAEVAIVREQIEALHDVEVFFSGAAKGVDSVAAGIAIRTFPEARHVIIVPRWRGGACGHYGPGVAAAREEARRLGSRLTVLRAPADASSEANGYLRRDDMLAVNGTHLLAFPPTRKEQKRGSGTWATIRRARKLDRVLKIVPLDGSKLWVERPSTG